jgi:adenine-specific DNA-methyltransferase
MIVTGSKHGPNAVTHTQSGRFTDLNSEKLRGGYYTPQALADWLCNWAVRNPSDRILEPSCGDGVFLEAAARRLATIGAAPENLGEQLKGVEISSPEAAKARIRLRSFVEMADTQLVEHCDFFAWWQQNQWNRFDCIVGNPPFIRYQSFPEPYRTLAMTMMAELGLTPNRLTNIWVPFVVAASALLRPGGRMAMVLPAELLQVSYASQLRSFLTDCFARIDIIACNELFFEKAEQEVVLLLAEGSLDSRYIGNTCAVALTEIDTVKNITAREPLAVIGSATPKEVRHESEKWLKYFLTETEIEFMRELRSSAGITNLSTHASVDVGVVTGKNEFFVLTAEQVKELGLEGYTSPLVSRSVQLRGTRLGRADWNALAAAGDRVHLLHITPGHAARLTEQLRRYIRFGEAQDYHKGYKCSIRTPWYAVPAVWTPDGFLFRQIYDFPRIVLNNSGATSTDTIHRLSCKTAQPERVIANSYTWLTAASAEIEGRSYGGGVLELEPTEAERLLMPAKLNGAMPLADADRLIRAGRLEAVLEENARIVLSGHMGLSAAECGVLRDIWIKMRDRRMARRKSSRKAAGRQNA